jgi:zona occludens toxin
MITFYEGMPRAGKSYSAMAEAIVPALKEGRKVFSNIAGLDHGKIAAAAGITIPKCCELLVQLADSQMQDVYKHVENDSLVVLDEAQDFWPTGRQKLSPEMTEFITRHGHRGLDIIIMGQAVKDVHALWRRRIERKHYFLKLTALGKPTKYAVTFFNAVLRGEEVVYEQIQTLEYEYDPLYFGTYKSHTDDTKNKSTLTESRAVVYNTKLFRKWLPIFGIFFICAIGYLVWFVKGGFTESVLKKPPQTAQAKITEGPQPSPSQLRGAGGYAPVGAPAASTTQPVPVPIAAPVPVVAPPSDAVEKLNLTGRMRFAGFMRVGDNIKGIIEWRDNANNLLHQMTFLDLAGLGYSVMVNMQGSFATLTKGATVLTALAWPVDKTAFKPSEAEQAKVAGTPRGYSVAIASDLPKSAGN